ncbi:hypothetical protein A1Q2_03399 [Trichosporon asahii var. asahii CBS 8904]|uniref:Mediator of RNA polymerase II transcription subunit 14 n=1 Tax=Trichosporon asahii var. asahii (strain CBS 8904) TaxID=1220162 RepID=K1VRY0_TRIAC|nr:hypothetical protein A1Q2_03399 [Trichosporon asahii var. asahii CBS 8904]
MSYSRVPDGAQSPSGPPTQPPAALHQLPQPVASSSRNPQLGPNPYFRYPTPTPEQIDEELPPYWETENVALGPMLDRLSRKGYGDMKVLVEQTLPPLAMRQKPKQIIEYAKTTRQAVLKYLALLRWKASVDMPSAPTTAPPAAVGAHSFPTPHSNGESNDTSPSSLPIKKPEEQQRGKVTDARRIQQFLEHQNAQHEAAIAHIRHVTSMVETLRERNADLLTAMSLRSAGNYTRLPSMLEESFVPRPKLKPAKVLDTVEKLNEHLLYRLRCVDYLPPSLVVEKVADGRAYVRGGGEAGWRAQLTVAGFDDDARWWLTGVEWEWTAKGQKKGFAPDERQQILDMVNKDILEPRPIPEGKEGSVDAPLVRVTNFLQHLSLSYQLEVLFSQALTLSQQTYRNQLIVDIDRTKKELTLKYWVRPRQAAPGQKRPGGPSTPIVGGIITFAITESKTPINDAERLLREVSAGTDVPADRPVGLELSVKWTVGDAGTGGGLKAGNQMDGSLLRIDSVGLSMKEILGTATRAHASFIARSTFSPLLANPRLALDPLNLPKLIESESAARPVQFIIPLPPAQGAAHFTVSVSATTGLIEIEDSMKDSGQVLENKRLLQTKLATASVNDQKTRLADDLHRLITAVILETIEDKMRQLGMQPTRRIPLRSHELTKTDLQPSSTIFVPLAVSQSHYFVSKITPEGVAYELLWLLRVPMENGGYRMAVGDRTPIDLQKLMERRRTKAHKRARDEDEVQQASDAWNDAQDAQAQAVKCRFDVKAKDLRDMFFYCNALVAQTIVEQQLKDRGIPYIPRYPDESDFPAPFSRSALAGMVPYICVNASELFKDGRATEVAAPQVYFVLKDWWKGSKCSVETIVRLQQASMSNDEAATSGVDPASSSASRAEGIKYDQATSTVRFHAPNIAKCVPDFLEQWERLSKVIIVAGEVNRLNKTEAYRDVRMLSFDLCTATLQYWDGFQVAITYTPTSDSYEVPFFKGDESASPHQLLAPLLSHHLNELTAQPSYVRDALGSNGKQFISLLRATLPLLLEQEALRTQSASEFPALVVRSVFDYRFVWDQFGTTRFALDITLSGNCRSFLLSDGARPRPPSEQVDLSCGVLTPIPNFDRVVQKGYQAARLAKVATPASMSTPGAAVAMTPKTPKTPGAGTQGKDARTPKTPAKVLIANGRAVGMPLPPAIKLDNGTTLMCAATVLQDVLRAMVAEIETQVAAYQAK